MIAHVCASTGWTWDYVCNHIDLPRLQHLNRYWRQHPPLHILAAAYMGFSAPDEAEQAAEQEAALQQMGAETLSQEEFEALLREKGLPV
ncbi:MAG: hypothetical protein Q4D82_01425 [Neisseria sp.]|nr:hypothetical protein [Neisseria sp.]